MKLLNMFKQAQDMLQNMEKLRADIRQKTVSVEVGAGSVVVVANGENELVSIKIRQDAIDPNDPTLLEDLIVSAVNEAMRQVKQLVTDEMSALTKKMDFPIPPELQK